MVELPSTPPRTSSLPSHSPRRSSPRSVNLTPRKSPPKWNALTDSEAGPEQEDEVDMLVARSPSTDTYPPVALSQSMSKPDIRINDRAMDFSDVVTIDDGRGGRMSIAKDFKGMGMAEKDARRPARLDLSRASNLQPAAPLSSSTLVPPLSGASTTSSTTTPASKRTNAIQPSISLLFSLTSRSSTLFVVLPAVLMSIISGLIPPYMTELIGVAFGAFTQYAIVTSTAISDSDLAAARSTLLASTKNSSLQFVALAVMILITSTASVGLWVLNGERVVKALRTEVFLGIGAREMAWFDLGMGAGSNKEAEEGEGEREGDSAGGQGAGGLLGRFARCASPLSSLSFIPLRAGLMLLLVSIEKRTTSDWQRRKRSVSSSNTLPPSSPVSSFPSTVTLCSLSSFSPLFLPSFSSSQSRRNWPPDT